MIKGLDIIIKKYNNHVHSTTQFTSNQVFYSNNDNLFLEHFREYKNSFKNINFKNTNFKEKEKCLLKDKFKIKKK